MPGEAAKPIINRIQLPRSRLPPTHWQSILISEIPKSPPFLPSPRQKANADRQLVCNLLLVCVCRALHCIASTSHRIASLPSLLLLLLLLLSFSTSRPTTPTGRRIPPTITHLLLLDRRPPLLILEQSNCRTGLPSSVLPLSCPHALSLCPCPPLFDPAAVTFENPAHLFAAEFHIAHCLIPQTSRPKRKRLTSPLRSSNTTTVVPGAWCQHPGYRLSWLTLLSAHADSAEEKKPFVSSLLVLLASSSVHRLRLDPE